MAKSGPKTDTHGDSEGPRCGGVEQGRHDSPQPPEVLVHQLPWPALGSSAGGGRPGVFKSACKGPETGPDGGWSGDWGYDPTHEILGVPAR